MYIEYDNTIAITIEDWKSAGLTYNQFRVDSREGLLRIARRSIDGNTLIDFRSIKRPERLAAIESYLGKYDDKPAVSINIDAAASNYYRTYTYTDKKGDSVHLPRTAIDTYTNEASILIYLKRRLDIMNMRRTTSTMRPKRKGEFFEEAARLAKSLSEPHNGNPARMPNKLPRNARSLIRSMEKFFTKNGCDFASLVHPNYGNSNSDKLTEEAKYWLIANFATPVHKMTLHQLYEAYNAECTLHEGWKVVKSEQTIKAFLDRPEVKPLWYGMRYGELEAKEKYTRQHRTLLPTMRDSLWYGDGTKINLYFRDKDGNMATTSVYEVMDVYSECLLGYYISDSENFEAQYYAYRRALQFSEHKPYEVKFDNQGGHKKLMAGEFFKKLAHLAISTAPYNGRSKTIESAFGRFQSQVLHQLWYFTGQNITATKRESHPNMEMILANKANLPTFEEACKAYVECREKWNQMPHYKTGVAHEAMYLSSTNPHSTKVDELDMIDIFGLISPKAIKYYSNGIQIEVRGIKYTYEVMTPEGTPDFEFLRNNVDRRFHVGYDPNDMSVAALYTKTPAGDYRFETMAKQYITVHRAKQDQDALDAAFIKAMELQNKTLRQSMQETTEQIMEQHGVHPSQHGLNMPKTKGINLKKSDGIGSYTKALSNVTRDQFIEEKY